jgi:hypothetical protein
VQTYRRIVCGYLLRPSEIFYSLTSQIDALDSLTVIALEVPNYIPDTGADCLLQFGLIRYGSFGCKAGIRSVPHSGPAIVIHDSVPEDAIKPSDGALLLPDFPVMFERLDVCGLQNVLGSRSVTQAA